jgi:hypothetical protein
MPYVHLGQGGDIIVVWNDSILGEAGDFLGGSSKEAAL